MLCDCTHIGKVLFRLNSLELHGETTLAAVFHAVVGTLNGGDSQGQALAAVVWQHVPKCLCMAAIPRLVNDARAHSTCTSNI